MGVTWGRFLAKKRDLRRAVSCSAWHRGQLWASGSPQRGLGGQRILSTSSIFAPSSPAGAPNGCENKKVPCSIPLSFLTDSMLSFFFLKFMSESERART